MALMRDIPTLQSVFQPNFEVLDLAACPVERHTFSFIDGTKQCLRFNAAIQHIVCLLRCPSGKVSALGPEGFHVRNPVPLKIRRVWGLLHVKSYVVVKRPPVGVAWKFGEGVPVQVSSSSSECGSKLRGPSQNSPLVASKTRR
ncbi:hypothetical protein AVEN_130773-1 [Araneus ventricosus]|uniref:Uncharacterized protein n=1 Tax=Araneus ventricosus TaxID=182803 RepID=A0A4Y2GHN3_ARAVE|nr:hypothetical protein AVEN_130773-1 [Araneus ventricosus]